MRVLIFLAIAMSLSGCATVVGKPSHIVGYRPATFSAKADESFFYSIGGKLRYSDQVNDTAPALIEGHIGSAYLVSPDGRKIAIVVNDFLYIVSSDGLRKWKVTPVAKSGPSRIMPVGEEYVAAFPYQWQWSRDSNSFFLLKSHNATQENAKHPIAERRALWKYDLELETFDEILKPFPAHRYFLGRANGVYFSQGDGTGELPSVFRLPTYRHYAANFCSC